MLNSLVKILGHTATLISSDTMVLDRWRWLKVRLPWTKNDEKVLDIGCGSGAFTIGLARRGYPTLGLSWDERNQKVAQERAELCRAPAATFEVFDVRNLDTRADFLGQYDAVVCCENIEHIWDDAKLIRSMAACLKPGGRLLLTTPHSRYVPLNSKDGGPFRPVEDGGHVRRGYSPSMLKELCIAAGLEVEEISYCSGYLSQKITGFYRFLSGLNGVFAWAALFPLRIIPVVFDGPVSWCLGWPCYSICLTAYKPRFSCTGDNIPELARDDSEHRQNL